MDEEQSHSAARDAKVPARGAPSAAAAPELRQVADALQSVFGGPHLCVACLDTALRFVRVNGTYAAMSGRSPEWFVGRSHSDLFASVQHEAVFRHVLDSGQEVVFHEKPFEHPARPGAFTWWDWAVRAVRTDSGQAVGLVLSLLDVTERVETRRRLERERQRLADVMGMFPGFVAIKDRHFRFRYVNCGFVSVFCEPADRPCYDVQAGLTSPCPDCPMANVLEHGQICERDILYRERTYHVRSLPFADVDGEPVMIQFGLDVTETRRLAKQMVGAAESERRRLGRDLHDTLGQNLTGLSYLAEALVGRVQRGGDGPAVELAGRCAETARAAVAQLRQISHGLDPVGLEAEGLVAALRKLAQDVGSTSSIPCRFACAAEVSLDQEAATQVYRIVQEALNNAAKHSRANGIELSLSHQEGCLAILVEDDGAGLPAGGPRGDGMGMRVMRYRAESIGGTLSVGPRRGGGTTVSCFIPSQRTPQAGSAAAAPPNG